MTPGETAPLLLTIFLVLFLTLIRANVVEINTAATLDDYQSLQYHLCGAGAAQLNSNTTLVLSEGTHILEEGPFCVIQNLSNITIQGQGQFTVIMCHRKNDNIGRGISFFNISTLRLSNFEILQFGKEILVNELPSDINNTFAYLVPQQNAAVIISHSTEITIESVNIIQSYGFGILFVNAIGNTVLDEVEVSDTNSEGFFYSGSGIAFVYDDSQFTKQLVKSGVNYNTSLSIVNSLFCYNYNSFYSDVVIKLYDILLRGIRKEPIPLTGGLSIAVFSGQRDYYVDININNTDIVGNQGNVPNLFVVHYDTITTTRTQLDQVRFIGNEVTVSVYVKGRGSGFFLLVTIFYESLHMLQSTQDMSIATHDIATVHHSLFIGNYFTYNYDDDGGGTITCCVTQQNITNIRITVKDTNFTNNRAIIGPALSILQQQSFVPNRDLYVYLENIIATGNNASDSYGVFAIRQASLVTIIGTQEKGCLFHNNVGSVFTSEGTNVILAGNIEFTENHSSRGGALNLVSGSVLFIYNGSNITFTRNIADMEGGAIFVNTLTSLSIFDTCSIQFVAEERVRLVREEVQRFDLSIIFNNNSANTSGNSIYGNSLYYCNNYPTTLVDSTLDSYNIDLLYNELFQFSAKVGNMLSEINSLPESICICKTSLYTSCTDKDETDTLVVPGATIMLYLVPLDEAEKPVSSILYSSLNVSGFSLGSGQHVKELPGKNECIAVYFQIYAPENISVSLILTTGQGILESSFSFKTASCPLGFTFNDNQHACICSNFIEKILNSICGNNHTIVRPANYWIGTETTENSSTMVQFVTTCPINYCNKTLTYVDLTIQDHICVENRTGRICGKCKGHLSSVFGVADCRQCSNAWLATLLLFALVGILQVIFYFLLDFTITHGLINGLFFYSNIVIVNSSIFFYENESDFLFWYVSWLNLDLGFPMCFYNGMTESAKAGLQYVYPTYLILIIILIIVLSQHSLLMQRLFSQLSGIHVLVSMFYISLLKIFRTVIDTATYVDIISEGNDEPIPAWFYDGNQNIRDPLAIILIVLASVTLILGIIPYVLFFTFFNLIQRWITSTRINAFVDANLAPYKPELRFWFGARLVLTTIIYIIITNRGISNPILTLTLELSFLVVFAIVQAYIHPFKSQIVSLVDLSIMINLILLTLGTSYTIQNENRIMDQKTLVDVSLSVVFITNIGIILCHLLMVLRRNKTIDKRVKNLLKKITKLTSNLKLGKWKAVMKILNGTEDEGGEENDGLHQDECIAPQIQVPSSSTVSLQDLSNSQVKRQRPIHHSGSQLREPLLGPLDNENTPTA